MQNNQPTNNVVNELFTFSKLTICKTLPFVAGQYESTESYCCHFDIDVGVGLAMDVSITL